MAKVHGPTWHRCQSCMPKSPPPKPPPPGFVVDFANVSHAAHGGPSRAVKRHMADVIRRGLDVIRRGLDGADTLDEEDAPRAVKQFFEGKEVEDRVVKEQLEHKLEHRGRDGGFCIGGNDRRMKAAGVLASV